MHGAVEVVAGLAQFRFLPSVGRALSGGGWQQIAASDPAAEQVVLWDQTQDVTCNRHCANRDPLEEALTQAWRPFWEPPARGCITACTTKQTLPPHSFHQNLNGKWY